MVMVKNNADLAAVRVLIIEDEAMVRVTLVETLRHLGIKFVASASDAFSALKAGQEFKPDAIFCDIDLGTGPHGIDIAHALREAVEAQELLTVVDTTVDGADNAAHSALPFEKARELECLGLRWKGNTLIVGAPEERWFEVEDFADSLGIKIELVATTSAEIREALSLTATLQKVEKTSLDVSRIEVGEAPISNLIQQLIERSVLERASDHQRVHEQQRVLHMFQSEGR